MSPFKQRVIKIIQMIPYGKVASYGQVALYCGVPRAAREVGYVLKETQEDVPWWRVVNNSGRISIEGNFHADKPTQRKLLEQEEVVVNDDYTFDIEKYRWRVGDIEIKSMQLPDEVVMRIIEKYGV